MQDSGLLSTNKKLKTMNRNLRINAAENREPQP